MTSTAIPDNSEPLNPVEYWQESLAAWTEFNQRTHQIIMEQTNWFSTEKPVGQEKAAENMASEYLRNLSDFNLRHWQNTARMLDALPNWMTSPKVSAGSTLTDWFDQIQRAQAAAFAPATKETVEATVAASAAPSRLDEPEGDADDLTRIKGIGPKLSEKLNELGIYHFKQIAVWNDTEAEWVEDSLAFKGRVRREDWIGQARLFSANGDGTAH